MLKVLLLLILHNVFNFIKSSIMILFTLNLPLFICAFLIYLLIFDYMILDLIVNLV